MFERALLASRLVDSAELVEIAQRLPSDPPGYNAGSDDRLARRLIQRGLLNSWQVEQLRAGRTKFNLGPYLIVDAIGKGGMGHLFKGRHALLGRIEAIKVLPKSRSTPQSIASFLHEIRAQSQLDHPNLVRVSFAGRDGDTHYLVTEFVPGVDLRRLVRRCGALKPDEAASIIAQTADALEYAHRRGMVHRDVKPGNLLVQPDGVVKLTDLGLAWSLGDGFGDAPNRTGKIVGTCDYLAPESIEQPDKIIPVSDIYSLGCTLYYLVTGKVPYPGGNTSTKMRRHLDDQPISPKSFNPDIPVEMTELIVEMMQRDHHKRTPSAQVVADRLRPLIRPETSNSLAGVVASCGQSGGGGNGAAKPAADLGDTLVSLTSDGAAAIEQHDLTGIDHDSTSSEPSGDGSRPTASFELHEPIRLIQPGSRQSASNENTAPISEPPPERRDHDRPVKLVVAAAVGASAAIMLAAALRLL